MPDYKRPAGLEVVVVASDDNVDSRYGGSVEINRQTFAEIERQGFTLNPPSNRDQLFPYRTGFCIASWHESAANAYGECQECCEPLVYVWPISLTT